MTKLDFSFKIGDSLKFINEIKHNSINFCKIEIDTGYSQYTLTPIDVFEQADEIINDIDITDYILGHKLDEVIDSMYGDIEFEDESDAMAFKLIWM